MREEATVHIGAEAIRVGTLIFQSDGARQHSVFTYDDAWMRHPEGFPISPTMPFNRRTFFHSRGRGPHTSAFPPTFADTCPDAWGQAIINRDRRAGSRPVCDWDYLSGVDDASRLGALRFSGRDGAFIRAPEAGRPIVPPLLDLADLMRAADAVESRTETARDLRRLLGNGSSLGGARPKCTVVDADGSLLIAKFTSRQDTLPVERMEAATLRLARRVGLDAPDARILEVAGRPVALITRFDRGAAGRIPYVSAQTMLGADDADGASYEAIGSEILRHCARPKAQLRELYARVAFTILVSNVDDHLRNHGFVYTGQHQWSLSPVFDVNPSPDRDRRLKTTIAEGSGDEASIAMLLDHAKLFRLDRDEAATLIGGMARRIEAEWRGCARGCGMSAREVALYGPAFEHEEAEIARGLSPGVRSHGSPPAPHSGASKLRIGRDDEPGR